MNIREACAHIMGKELAASIIADPRLGLGWCVIAAMTECKISHGPQCKAAIDAWLAESKKRNRRTGSAPPTEPMS